jgi:hypothetical protein
MRKWPVFWLVVAATFACFAPALRNGLLDWDDAGYVLENVHIRSLSLETVRWAFTEFCCNYWAPLTWLSLAADFALWGIDPVGYHLTNVVLHALNAGLLYLICLRLLRPPAAAGEGTPEDPTASACAGLAALFFGLHPLRVESVAWVAERKDVLSALLGLGAVLAYLRFAQGTRPGPGASRGAFLRSSRWWLVLALYGGSLLGKATLITLPFALLVLDWYPLRRLARGGDRGVLLEKVPLLLPALGAALITARAMAPTSKTLAEIDGTTRVVTAFTSLLQYLWLTAFPVGISPVYFHAGNTGVRADHLAAIVVVVALGAWAVLGARRRPAILAGGLLFVGMIFPVLGLAQNSNQEIAARFTYFPSMPLSLLAAAGIVATRDRLSVGGRGRRLLWGAVGAMLVALAALTVRDIGAWRDDGTLWSRVIELRPHRFGKPYAQRAIFLEGAGRIEEALADVDEALAIASRKRYGAIHEIYAHRARLRRRVGDAEGALGDFGAAIEVAPEPYRSMYLEERAAVLSVLDETGRAGAGPGPRGAAR